MERFQNENFYTIIFRPKMLILDADIILSTQVVIQTAI